MSQNTYYLMRHSLTTRGEKTRMTINSRLTDDHYHLTLVGKKIAQTNLARFKKHGHKIDLILCSPFIRTRETAQLAAKYFHCPVKVEIRLKEIMDRAAIEGKSYLSLPRTGIKKSLTVRPPGGESFNDVLARLTSLMKDLDKKYQHKKIMLVSHGDPLWLLLHLAKGHHLVKKILKPNGDKKGWYPRYAQPTKLPWKKKFNPLDNFST